MPEKLNVENWENRVDCWVLRLERVQQSIEIRERLRSEKQSIEITKRDWESEKWVVKKRRGRAVYIAGQKWWEPLGVRRGCRFPLRAWGYRLPLVCSLAELQAVQSYSVSQWPLEQRSGPFRGSAVPRFKRFRGSSGSAVPRFRGSVPANYFFF